MTEREMRTECHAIMSRLLVREGHALEHLGAAQDERAARTVRVLGADAAMRDCVEVEGLWRRLWCVLARLSRRLEVEEAMEEVELRMGDMGAGRAARTGEANDDPR